MCTDTYYISSSYLRSWQNESALPMSHFTLLNSASQLKQKDKIHKSENLAELQEMPEGW